MEKTLLGYIVFVSYNRDEYEMDDIAIDELVNYLQTQGLEENWWINVVELDKFGEI